MFKRWIPERDTGPSISAPQAKPRRDLKSQNISSNLLGHGDSSIASSIESGLDNHAYVNDETDEPHQQNVSSNRSSASESDSSNVNNSDSRRISQFSKPDNYKTELPRPKPRRKTEQAIDSGSETYTCTTDSSVAQSPVRYSRAQEHVIVSIPEKPSDVEFKEPKPPKKLRDRRHIADSDVESGNQDEIELQNMNRPVRDRPHSRTAESEFVNYVSEVTRGETTKSLLERENVEGIQRLQSMLSPGRTIQNQPSTSTAFVASPSKRERRRMESGNTDDRKFGVYIHYCDLLPVDPNVVHPVVKVYILNQDGTCVARSMRRTSTDNTHKVSSPDVSSSKEKRSKKRRTKRSKSGKEGGDSTSETTQKPQDKSAIKLPFKLTTKAILPIMTQPCKLSYYLPTFAPFWNELLLFDEPFNTIVQPDTKAMLFFEIMDFLPLAGPHKNSRTWSGYHGNEQGWYKVAWGFLKLVGANGSRNVNRKLKLQLYRPETIPTKQRIPEMAEVYQWWKLGKRNKLNSSLCITVKAVLTPKEHIENLDKMLNLDENQLSQALLDSQVDANNFKNGKRIDKGKTTEVAIPQWTRLEGQTCKIPNKLIKNLPESQMESFNIGISGDVYCVKFSPCGLKLAAGLHGDDYHSILIFEIPSGRLIANIKSHYGLVYDIDWRVLDSAMMPNSYYLATASADSVSCVWELRSPQNTEKLVKKLLHPSFVYCVKFHPKKPNLVFTGCFDCAIRIWDIGRSSPERAAMHESDIETVPIALLNEHKSYVNTMIFGPMGNSLYSGDGTGTVIEWATRPSGRKKSWTKERELSFSEAGKSPVNSLDMHPNGNRLLVHIRNSLLKLVDISTFLVLQSYNGLVNDKLQIRSCFSPCGNLVLSGSEDGMICFWDVDTGSILQFLVSENHKNATVSSVHYHPHDHYVAVGFASSFNEPCPIALYAYKAVRSAKLRFQTLTKLATWTSTSSEQVMPDLNDDGGNVGESGAATSDKFMMIIKKLDSALKLTRKPNSTTALVQNDESRRSSNPLTNDIPPAVFQNTAQPSKAPRPITSSGDTAAGTEKSPGSPVAKQRTLAPAVRTNFHGVGDTGEDQIGQVAHDQVSLQNNHRGESSAPNSKQRQKRRDKMRLARNFDNFIV